MLFQNVGTKGMTNEREKTSHPPPTPEMQDIWEENSALISNDWHTLRQYVEQ